MNFNSHLSELLEYYSAKRKRLSDDDLVLRLSSDQLFDIRNEIDYCKAQKALRLRIMQENIRVIDELLEEIDGYLRQIAHLPPGVDRGITMRKNHLERERALLEKRKAEESISCWRDIKPIDDKIQELKKRERELQRSLNILYEGEAYQKLY